MDPTVVTSRFDHSASKRQRVTCALPGEPMRMRSSPRELWFKRLMMAGQFLRLLNCFLLGARSRGFSTAILSVPIISRQIAILLAPITLRCRKGDADMTESRFF